MNISRVEISNYLLSLIVDGQSSSTQLCYMQLEIFKVSNKIQRQDTNIPNSRLMLSYLQYLQNHQTKPKNPLIFSSSIAKSSSQLFSKKNKKKYETIIIHRVTTNKPLVSLVCKVWFQIHSKKKKKFGFRTLELYPLLPLV